MMKKVVAGLFLLLLTSCSSWGTPPTGELVVTVDAAGAGRCNDGIRVSIAAGENWLRPLKAPAGLRSFGDYWFWVEPGAKAAIGWEATSDLDAAPAGKTIDVAAECMRRGQPSGSSRRSFTATNHHDGFSFYLELKVRDTGSDPPCTGNPPGLLIEVTR